MLYAGKCIYTLRISVAFLHQTKRENVDVTSNKKVGMFPKKIGKQAKSCIKVPHKCKCICPEVRKLCYFSFREIELSTEVEILIL